MTLEELLAVAEAQRERIRERREKLENRGRPLLDIEWQFASGMVTGASEVIRAMVEAVAKTGQLGGEISDLKPTPSTDEKPEKGR